MDEHSLQEQIKQLHEANDDLDEALTRARNLGEGLWEELWSVVEDLEQDAAKKIDEANRLRHYLNECAGDFNRLTNERYVWMERSSDDA